MPLFEGAEVWEALVQIAEKGYDAGDLPADATGRVRWGVAFCGRRVAVACERVG